MLLPRIVFCEKRREAERRCVPNAAACQAMNGKSVQLSPFCPPCAESRRQTVLCSDFLEACLLPVPPVALPLPGGILFVRTIADYESAVNE